MLLIRANQPLSIDREVDGKRGGEFVEVIDSAVCGDRLARDGRPDVDRGATGGGRDDVLEVITVSYGTVLTIPSISVQHVS